jgi:purine nucleoside phosphorylase
MVTNKGTGLADRPLAHDDVLAVGRDAGARLAGVIEGVLRRLATQSTGTK